MRLSRGSGSIAPPLRVVDPEADASVLDPPGAAAEEVWTGPAGGVFASCRVAGDTCWIDLPGLATFRVDPGGDCVLAAPRPGVDPAAVAEAYWHAALPLVLHARGAEVLHGSAVLMARGVVALCGASGSGKSTIGYALDRRGWALWADDTLALDISASGISALSVPFDVRLRPPAAAHFGLGSRDARPVRGLQGGAAAPLQALCVLARETEAPAGDVLGRLGAAEACPALLAHAWCVSLKDAARKRVMLERYLRLLARVPVFRLRVAAGLGGLPDIVAAVESAFGVTGAGPGLGSVESTGLAATR
jgi:hypothetical protein